MPTNESCHDILKQAQQSSAVFRVEIKCIALKLIFFLDKLLISG